MKIFIDGFGVLGHALTRKLIENHGVSPNSLFVNSYVEPSNACYMEYLTKTKIRVESRSYKDLDFIASILEFKPDYIFSFYGRRIFPASVLAAAQKFSINLHPSMLPDYKGCFSCPWAIINNEKYTGITIHKMVESVDAGDILYQEMVGVDQHETAYSLYNKMIGSFVRVFDEFFDRLVAGNISPIKMIGTGRYYSRAVPYNGVIDPAWPDSKIESFIRAMHFPPHPGALLVLPNRIAECDSFERYLELKADL